MRQDGLKFFLLLISVILVGLGILVSTTWMSSPYRLIAEGGVDYDKNNIFWIIIFYIGIVTFFSGLFAVIFFWIRRKVSPGVELYLSAKTSFRQGVLMGILVCLLLLLQSFRIFIWWDALLVVAGISLIEMYLVVR